MRCSAGAALDAGVAEESQSATLAEMWLTLAAPRFATATEFLEKRSREEKFHRRTPDVRNGRTNETEMIPFNTGARRVGRYPTIGVTTP